MFVLDLSHTIKRESTYESGAMSNVTRTDPRLDPPPYYLVGRLR